MEIKIPFTDLRFRMSLKRNNEFSTWSRVVGGSDAINENTATCISAVYACVDLYARELSSLPLVMYKNGPKGKVRATDHPLYEVLHDKVNPYMTSYKFRTMMEACLKLHGNAYAYIEFNEKWLPKYLWPLHPSKVTPWQSKKTGEIFYDVNFANGEHKRLRAYQMLHIAGLSFDGVQGKSVIRNFAETMGFSKDLESYGRKFFKNGAHAAGVLRHPGSLSEQAQKRLEDKFERFGGLENAGKTLLLEEGLEYQQISIAPEEAQFLESRKFSVSEICRIFHVPPHMIGDLEHATFSNIEFQDLSFGKHSMTPECINWEQEINSKLLSVFDHGQYKVKFLMDNLVRGDLKSRYEAYGYGKQHGFLTTNDIREKEDMNRVEGGDTLYVPMNMIDEKMAGTYWQTQIDSKKSTPKGGE